MRSLLVRWWNRVRETGTGLPLLDVLVGGGLAVAAIVDSSAGASLLHPQTEVLSAVVAGSVVLRTRAPLVMTVVAAGGFAGYAALPGTSAPLWAFLTILVVGFSAAAHLVDGRRLTALGLLLAVTYFVQILDAHRTPGELAWAEVYLTPLVLVLAPACAGWLLQRSRHQTAEVRRLALELAAERERYAAVAAEAERNRIARELHDIISHAVSVMVVQAGAVEHRLAPDSPVMEQVRTIREAGKNALAELRRQLGLLGPDGYSSTAPIPSLDGLAGLVRASGATLHCAGEPAHDVPAGIELTAYRVVQEAVTNAARHAAGASTRVELTHHVDGIAVEVTNDRGTLRGDRGSGRGLVGMRERVALYGGTLTAGPYGAGWRVRVWLPLELREGR